MILYKYASFDVAQKIVFGRSIGFTPVNYFNDPFETTAFAFGGRSGKKVSDKLAASAFKEKLNSRYGVLSLTRQPLNPLMWAHYGMSHSGAVIGIDVEEAGLNDPGLSLICASQGEVVYSATKPVHAIDVETFDESLLENIDSLSFESVSSNFFKRAFLYKSLEWSYEEEVRVIKNVTKYGEAIPRGRNLSFENQHGHWEKISVENRPLYLFELPQSSIKEIYLGANVYSRNVSQLEKMTGGHFSKVISDLSDLDVPIYHAEPEFGSWRMKARERS
jgi:Protein of unknown function (DUF2971)